MIHSNTSFVVDYDTAAVNLAVGGVLIGSNKVLAGVKLDEAVAPGLAFFIPDHPHALYDTVLLPRRPLTSNSYFSVFSSVL